MWRWILNGRGTDLYIAPFMCSTAGGNGVGLRLFLWQRAGPAGPRRGTEHGVQPRVFRGPHPALWWGRMGDHLRQWVVFSSTFGFSEILTRWKDFGYFLCRVLVFFCVSTSVEMIAQRKLCSVSVVHIISGSIGIWSGCNALNHTMYIILLNLTLTLP